MFNLHDDNDFEPEHSASVTDQVLTVYEMAVATQGATSVREDPTSVRGHRGLGAGAWGSRR